MHEPEKAKRKILFFELPVGNGCRNERTEPKAAGRAGKKMKIRLLDAKGPQKPVR
jgi:hypothetical protein